MGEIETDSFDVITNHDCIHDLVDPVGVLRTVRRALKRDGARPNIPRPQSVSIFLDSVRVRAGVFFSGEPKSGENLGENLGSAMASGYGISTLHCTTVSLAHGGMGLGSAFGPKKYEGLVKEAGFLSFDTVGSNPMNNFCERRL